MAGIQNRPDYRLTLEGRTIGPGGTPPLPELAARFVEALSPRLVSLTLTEKRGGDADQLDIVLDDSDGALEIPTPGQVLSLQLGWAAGASVNVGLIDKGRFKVDEAEWEGAPDRITIRARAADFAASFDRRREKPHVGRSLGAILAEIAASQGLTLKIDAGLAAIEIAVFDQDELSDAAVLRILGRRYDAAATVKNGVLLFMPIGDGKSAGGKPLQPGRITRASGDSARYKRGERGQYGGVEARWHDRDRAKRETVKVGEAGDKPPKRLKRIYGSEKSARHAADSANRKMDRAAAEFEITLALGRPDLFPERPLEVAGFKPEIDAQRWLIAECRHDYSASSGLTTQLRLEARGRG